ncbi:MAG TPA: PEGA domain-containing protein [Trueperaceae bacterium]
MGPSAKRRHAGLTGAASAPLPAACSPHAPFRRAGMHAVALLIALLVSSALAQVSVPTFGVRGVVPDEVLASFMTTFRSAVGAATGLEVKNGERITSGIAGSLDPELSMLIAEVDSARYAVSGEVARIDEAGPPAYVVNLIVVDAQYRRATDVITTPLDVANPATAAADLAALVAEFTTAQLELPAGDAGLFVSSEPGDAQVFVDGVAIGHTGQLDVAMLRPGRYQVEVRKEGFLPEVRMVELRAGDTSFLPVVLTPISGGSVQVTTYPAARVWLDGEPAGVSPATLPALPGIHTITLERDGFEPETHYANVRNYRVTRVETTLTPAAPLVVFWDEQREVLVYVDGRLQPGGFAPGIEPGLREFELVRGTDVRRYLRAVPDTGAYRLDLLTGDLVPLEPR